MKEPAGTIPVKGTSQAPTPPNAGEKPTMQVREAFMEQDERVELSGQMINQLIQLRAGQGLNKQLNLLQTLSATNNQMSITSKQSEAVTLLDA